MTTQQQLPQQLNSGSGTASLQNGSVDWGLLTQPFYENDHKQLVNNLLLLLEGPKKRFKELQLGLKEKCLEQVSEVQGVKFLSECLRCIFMEADGDCNQGQNDVMLGHLLLELFPNNRVDISTAIDDSLRKQLFFSTCTIKRARVAVKLAQALQISWTLLSNEERKELEQYVYQLWEDKALYSQAVGLLTQFKELQEKFDVKDCLELLLTSSGELVAERWLGELDREYQIYFVNMCVDMERLRTANKIVTNLQLQEDFPYVEAMYRRSTLTRLAQKQQWQVAATFVGEDKELQEELIVFMVMAGEYKQAQEFCEKYGLDPSLAEVDEKKLQEEEQKRREKYFQLPMEMNLVRFVDKVEDIDVAECVLGGQGVIGLDVEWKPEATSVASILQVGCSDGIFIFDLVALHTEQRLDQFLGSLFGTEAIIKLGFDFGGDWSRLRRSYPNMHAFNLMNNFVEVKEVWSLFCKRTQQVPTKGFGLSALSEALFKKPLDKSMQCSDWEQRPLRPLQLRYAALDALVLVLILENVLQPKGPLFEPEIKSLVKTLTPASISNKRSRQLSEQRSGTVKQTNDEDDNDNDINNGNSKEIDVSLNVQNGARNSNKQAKVITLPQNQAWIGPSQSLSSSLQQSNLQHSLIQLQSEEMPTARAEEAADSLGVDISQIAKSVALVVGGREAVIAVVPGDKRVDLRHVAEELQVSRRQVRVASKEQCIEEFGYAPGVMPAFGLKCECTVLVDQSFLDQDIHQTNLFKSSNEIEFTENKEFVNLDGCQSNLSHVSMGVCVNDSRLGQHGSRSLEPQDLAQSSNSQMDNLKVRNMNQNTQPGKRKAPRQPTYEFDTALIINSFDDVYDVSEYDPKNVQNQEQNKDVHFETFGDALNFISAPCDRDDYDMEEDSQTLPPQQSQLVFVKQQGQQEDFLYCGAGNSSQVVKLSVTDLLRVSKGRVGYISESTTEWPDVNKFINNFGQVKPDVGGGVKFMLDSMLGRLCRWLRCLGVDAEFSGTGHARRQVIQLALNATEQGRVFLTRDVKLATSKDAAAVYLLAHDDPAHQLREIADHFGITMNEETIMSRCSKCNAAEFAKIQPREKARSLVPERVFKVVKDFWQCGNCAKVFWVGPKSQAAIELVSGVLSRKRTNADRKYDSFWNDGYAPKGVVIP